MSYLYGIPQAKLAEMIGNKIHLAWAKIGSTYTLTKVEGNRIYTEDAFGVKGQFSSKDACYIAELLPASLR